ncbi:MAG: hypothetical protein JWR77_2238 [Rhizorhabdus sp.]|nr:hypothetical protein [Rhizorhabdus sp.]
MGDGQPVNNTDLIRYGITFAIIAVIMALRLRNMRKARKLRIETLWIIPALYLAATGFLFWRMPPAGLDWLWNAIALMLGAALGWQRGRMINITVDPDTHVLNHQSSPAAFVFILVLVVVRLTLKSAMESGDAYWHPSANLVTEIFIASAAGLLTFYRIEMFIRARRLLREARGF